MDDQNRFEELRPGFIRWFRILGFVFVVSLLAIGITYGRRPYILVGIEGRTVISIAACISLVGCVYTGGMLLYVWLLDRYVDKSK